MRVARTKDQVILDLKNKIRVLEHELKCNHKTFETLTENRIRSMRKNPKYYYSFSGMPILKQWIYWNGLTLVHAEILIILSYYQYAYIKDLISWNLHRRFYEKPLEEVIKMGYVIRVTNPGKNNLGKSKPYVLTQKGKDLEADYEKFYDKKIADLNNKTFSEPIGADQTDYFRRAKISKPDRREAQGGGWLPRASSVMVRFKDREVGNEKA